MRKTLTALLAAAILLMLPCCNNKELHMGINAEITAIDVQSYKLVLRDADASAAVFGEGCEVNCRKAAERGQIIYVDYKKEKGPVEIDFGELKVGDYIIMSMYDSEKDKLQSGNASVKQIQLATQRLG